MGTRPQRKRDVVVVVLVLLTLACADLALLAVLATGPGWTATGGRLASASLAEQAGGLAQALRFGLAARTRTLPTG